MKKPWRSFLITGLRHKDDFMVARKILEKFGYKFDGDFLIHEKDYQGAVITLPGKSITGGFSLMNSNIPPDETDEDAEGRPLDWSRILPAVMPPEAILNLKELLDYYNKSHFD